MSEKRATLERIAPSIEEAVQAGLTELGLPEDAVEIDILDEGTKGLFGIGSRQARVRLTVKSDEPESQFMVDAEPEAETQIEEVIVEAGVEPRETKDDPSLKVARETVEELLDKMQVRAKVTAHYGEIDETRSRPPICVDIHGDDLSILIGKKAETLDALQYITKLILGKELERSIPIIVDVEGFRGRREDQIRHLANTVARQVGKSGRSQALEPMPAHERRIAHIELRNDPDVFTESSGERDRRKVVIHPKG